MRMHPRPRLILSAAPAVTLLSQAAQALNDLATDYANRAVGWMAQKDFARAQLAIDPRIEQAAAALKQIDGKL